MKPLTLKTALNSCKCSLINWPPTTKHKKSSVPSPPKNTILKFTHAAMTALPNT